MASKKNKTATETVTEGISKQFGNSDEQELLNELGTKPFTIDSVTGLKIIEPSSFTLLDAQQHYNEINPRRSKMSVFSSKGGLKEFSNVTINDIVTDDDETFILDLISKFKNKKESARTKALQNVRLILGEIQNILPKEFSNNFSKKLPTSDHEHPQTRQFFKSLSTKPDKTEANLSIIDDPVTIRSFFNSLEEHADRNAQDRPIVDAIIYGANTGLRVGLITGVEKRNVIFHDDENNTVSLAFKSEQEGVKDSPTLKGGKRASIIRIPLNTITQNIIRKRYALAEKYKLGQFDKIFFLEVLNNKTNELEVKNLTSNHINDVLGEVVVEGPDGGIVENLNLIDDETMRGQISKTLHIPKGSKSGAKLLRNVHTHLAYQAGIPPDKLDMLQGRKAVEGQAAQLGYRKINIKSPFPEDVVDELKKWSSYYNDIQVFTSSDIYSNDTVIGPDIISNEIEEDANDILFQGKQEREQIQKNKTDEILANKEAVRNEAKNIFGITDTQLLDAFSQAIPNPSKLEEIINTNVFKRMGEGREEPWDATSLSTLIKQAKKEFSSKPQLTSLTNLAKEQREINLTAQQGEKYEDEVEEEEENIILGDAAIENLLKDAQTILDTSSDDNALQQMQNWVQTGKREEPEEIATQEKIPTEDIPGGVKTPGILQQTAKLLDQEQTSTTAATTTTTKQKEPSRLSFLVDKAKKILLGKTPTKQPRIKGGGSSRKGIQTIQQQLLIRPKEEELVNRSRRSFLKLRDD